MLMMIGPVKFQLVPMNVTSIGHGHETAWVEKPVMGTMPPVEWVGEGPETWTMQGKLFPHRFGGLGDLKVLQEARKSGLPQYMMRGDGAMMGWVVIERVSERSSFLDRGGVGRMIDFDLSVRRTQAPFSGLFFSIMEAVFR